MSKNNCGWQQPSILVKMAFTILLFGDLYGVGINVSPAAYRVALTDYPAIISNKLYKLKISSFNSIAMLNHSY